MYLSRADRDKYGIGAWGGLGLQVLSGVLIIYGAYLIASQHTSLTMLLITAVPIAIVGLIAQVLMYVALYRLDNDLNVGYLTAGIIILLFVTVLSVIPFS